MTRRRDSVRGALALLVCGLLAAWLPAAVPTSGRARLEQLTRLPQVSFTTGLSFHPVRGYALMTAEGAQVRDIEDLRRRLAGNASDAPLHAQLAERLAELGENRLSDQALARAAELYRQQGAEDSQDAGLMTGYAKVLQAQGRADEAERVLRKAVQSAPNQWRPHALLAQVLASTALQAILPSAAGDSQTSWVGPWLSEGAGFRPETAAAEQARRLLAEAVAAADRAVLTGPDQAEAYAARAAVRASQRLLEAILAPVEPAGERQPLLPQALFHPDALPDLRRAAELSAEDPQAWGCVAWLEVLAVACQQGDCIPEALLRRELWPVLPDRTRAAVRAVLARLERLGEDAEPRRASSALAVAGLLQFFLVGDVAGGQASLRRAVALDPSNGNGWETLTFALAFSRQFDALLAVCRQRVEQRDTPRNRLLLAKALEKNQQLDALLDEAVATQHRYPEDLLANFTLGAALLKVDRTELGRARALQYLAKATRLAGDNPPSELAAELLFQRGLWFALDGQIENARAQFHRLLEIAPGHPEALEALKAIEQVND